ncbi:MULTISPECIES: Ig-like domain-containing protein [Actinoplanes]|uniref:Ig-like domain-containing protein n=1 Tax=Actinoplanes TaxID=1865 RepID=UPI0005F2EF4E|nr:MULTISPECIES: Ig-like domain-containing protein [Actinoplanes]
MLRSAVVTALSTSLILTAGTPALADDTSAPVVTSTGLTEGQWVGQARRIYPIYHDDVAVEKVNVLLDGTLWRSYTGNAGRAGISFTPPDSYNDHAVEVTVQAVDAAGNKGQATTLVNVDTERPAATLPAQDSVLHGPVELTPVDVSSDTAELQLSVDGQVVATAVAAPWTLAWDTSVITRPGATVNLRVKDRAGNLTATSRFYTFDNVGPRITTSIPSVVTAEGIELTAALQDTDGSGRIEWWVDGVLRSTAYTYYHPGWGRKNRTATVEIRAWDRLGNRSTLTAKVRVDVSGPVVTWVSPANNALIRGRKVTSTVRVSDPTAMTTATLVPGNTRLVCTTCTLTTDTLQEGRNELTWYTWDGLINSTMVTRTVIVDNTKAKLAFAKAPKNKAKIKGKVAITASASDKNGIAKVQLLVNGKVVATDTKAAYKFTLNTAKYGKTIKVQLRAYDKAGNVTTTTTRTWRR